MCPNVDIRLCGCLDLFNFPPGHNRQAYHVCSWQFTFLVQVPCIVLATLLVLLIVRVHNEPAQESALRRIDYLGTTSLVGAVILLQLVLNSGGKSLLWNY